ncbi:uncharacterized protein LOC117297871 [Asterias rubens]|uniref:uncharacterized protein LOC117297871 n=1 Tax=Asterias rubens TaxID=7604 RepID=UPI00145511E6|nr:uncharacterized protein LOC117297871 [Asterias rubens]
MSGIVLTLTLLVCILVITEACSPSSTGSGGGNHTPSPANDGNVYNPGKGPIPPHPFRRRRDDNEDVSLDKKLQAMNKMMSELFDELDADDDTKVSKEEWVRRKGNAEDYVQIVATFDKNGDGLLSRDEFLAASKS